MHKITHIHFVFLTKTVRACLNFFNNNLISAILAISFAESNVNVSSI